KKYFFIFYYFSGLFSHNIIMSRPSDPLFTDEAFRDAINDFYTEHGNNVNVNEDNYQEFIDIVSEYVKYDILMSYSQLNQFAFKGENAERFNMDIRQARLPEVLD